MIMAIRPVRYVEMVLDQEGAVITEGFGLDVESI
jgi:hypothetical protein